MHLKVGDLVRISNPLSWEDDQKGIVEKLDGVFVSVNWANGKRDVRISDTLKREEIFLWSKAAKKNLSSTTL